MKFTLRLFSLLALCYCPAALSDTSIPFKVGLSVWTGYPTSVKGFKDGLAEAGLIEGKHIQFLMGKSGIDKAKQHEIAESFRDANVDLVYSLTTPGTVIIKKIMPVTTPVVFSIVTYPADSGLIESFDYSGNNLVGTSNFVSYKHYILLLNKMLPNVKSLAIFHRKGEPNSKIQAVNIRRLLKAQGVNVTIEKPSSLEETKTLAKALVGKVDVFMTTTDTLMQGGGEAVLIDIAKAYAIPILSSNKAGIEAGSTFGPVADFYTIGKISGSMAANILQNKVKPSQLSSQLQDPPQFLVNKKSAATLKLTTPSDLSVTYVNP